MFGFFWSTASAPIEHTAVASVRGPLLVVQQVDGVGWDEVAEIRLAHGPGSFTLVFDRGGYSGDAFRFLQAEGIGFITYLKGRTARRRYPQKLFRPRWFSFEDQRHVYKTFEKKTRVARVGVIRTVLFLGDEGQQIPVLTNLASRVKPARVVHCLRLRWRQENNFKYLTDHYAIDQIVQYGADPETQGRLIPNPRRKALTRRARSRNRSKSSKLSSVVP